MNQPFPPPGSDTRPLTNEMFDALQRYDPAFFATWAESLRAAWESPTLDERTQKVITFALDASRYVPSLILDEDVDAAFNAGSNIAELVDAIMRQGYTHGGAYSIHDGLEAIGKVVAEREASGLPAPRRGDGLSDADRIPERAFTWEHVEFTGPIFPYMLPSPRLHQAALKMYAPDYYVAFREWKDKLFMLRKELTRKTAELLAVADHAIVFWPAPFTDHHVHAALDVGANVQELVEAVLVAGRRGAGVNVIHYGLTAIGRVIDERQQAGVPLPGASTV